MTATIIIRIDDVTEEILKGVTSGMEEETRQRIIQKNISDLSKTYPKETWQEVSIRAFYEGNQYMLFVTEVFKDIRLVGAPPSSIGKFGSDTDNWVWPRRTGGVGLVLRYDTADNRPR